MTDRVVNADRVDETEAVGVVATDARQGGTIKKQLIEWMRQYLADLTGLDVAEIDINSNFDRYGIDSYQGVVITHELGQWLGIEIEASDAFEHPTIADLAGFLAADPRIVAALSRRGGGRETAAYEDRLA